MHNKNIDKALALVENILKHSTSKQNKKLLEELREQLHKLQKPNGYDKKSWVQILKELIKWTFISERIYKEIIDLWTSEE